MVRYDERGCGLSTADDVHLSLDTAVEEIEVVADAHGAERFALVGISGGAAAVAYAARHPSGSLTSFCWPVTPIACCTATRLPRLWPSTRRS